MRVIEFIDSGHPALLLVRNGVSAATERWATERKVQAGADQRLFAHCVLRSYPRATNRAPRDEADILGIDVTVVRRPFNSRLQFGHTLRPCT